VDKDEEIEHLAKRKKELRTIYCDLSDICDWFVKSSKSLQSDVSYSEELNEVLLTIDNIGDDLEHKIEALQESENE